MKTIFSKVRVLLPAAVAAAAVCTGAAAQGSKHASEQADPTRHGMAAESTAEPRTPSEFKFGEYHRSSKMTPEGSKGPETWGAERTDVGPPVPESDASTQAGGMSGASGEDEAERVEGSTRANAQNDKAAPAAAGATVK